jgi:hypothetical protein
VNLEPEETVPAALPASLDAQRDEAGLPPDRRTDPEGRCPETNTACDGIGGQMRNRRGLMNRSGRLER